MLPRMAAAPCRGGLSLVLVCLLALGAAPVPLAGQEQPAPKLNIVIIEGEGAVNNIRQRTAREPLVQVEDENRRPVAGATVTFLLPETGPSAVFPNGSRVMTVITNQQGRAVATGLRPNNLAGKFQIRVTASHQGMTGSATIAQTNVLAAAAAGAGASAKLIAIIAVAGGAAAGGAVIATRSGGGGGKITNGPPPVIITPGSPNVGAPR